MFGSFLSIFVSLDFFTPYTWVVIPSFLDVSTVLYPLRTLASFSPTSNGARSFPSASTWRVTNNSSLSKTGASGPLVYCGFSTSNLYVFESTEIVREFGFTTPYLVKSAFSK